VARENRLRATGEQFKTVASAEDGVREPCMQRPAASLQLDDRMSITLPVSSVPDTAFLTAFCRALETERPDAHFRDAYAYRLAGSRGKQLLQQLSAPDLTSSGCIVRTCLLDDCILEILRNSSINTVVNLGAGLDTRPYRLPLESSIRWIEVDHPDILEYKAGILARCRPACALKSIPLDIRDVNARRTLLQRIGTTVESVLTITEGLLIYLTQEQVASLARDLYSVPQFQWWLTDLVSPAAMRLMQNAAVEPPNNHHISLRFAPENGPEFFRQCGWETDEFHSCLEGGRRLNRQFVADALLSATLSREQWDILQNLYAVVKLKRAD
jgi:methyltransferase (TIGR00027 family)